MITRRGFIAGLLAAPAIVRPGLLMQMPRRPVLVDVHSALLDSWDNPLYRVSPEQAAAWLQEQMQRALAEALQIPNRLIFSPPATASRWWYERVQDAIDSANHGRLTVPINAFAPEEPMPLTEKGAEIKANMEQEYGPDKGESVFYASKNAGKITGVDAEDPNPIQVNTHKGPAITGEHFVPEGSSEARAAASHDYDPAELIGEFKTAGSLSIAQIQAEADAMWRRQYNDGTQGSTEPPPIPPV